MTRVYKYDLEGNLVDTYKTLKEAAIKNSISTERMYYSFGSKGQIHGYVYTKDPDYEGTIYSRPKNPSKVYTDYFTTKQVSEILEVSQSTVRRLALRGAFGYKYTEKGKMLIDETDFYNYLKTRK